MHAFGIPYEIRTRAPNVKGWYPWPLDERDICGRTGRTRTGTLAREILSLLWLPITPQSHIWWRLLGSNQS